GLSGVEASDRGLRIGAMVTYAGLLGSAEVAQRAPLLRLAAGAVTGGWSIRNQGTIGGAVAAARPQSDLPAALVACDAVAVVRGPEGERQVAVQALLAGAMRTTLSADELLCAFELPAHEGARPGYHKLKRGASSWPIATAAALVTRVGERCTSARLALGAVAATPTVVDISAELVGAAVTAATLASAARAAAAAVTEPWEDELAPAEYRAAVAEPVARRALEMAFGVGADGTVSACD
ncbi:MAG: FAD binding domain-containing protein, partial [Solirubrobacteraceae bacterium]